MMNQPDDKVVQELDAIGRILSAASVSLADLKAAVVRLLSHLASPRGRTDANCRAVDSRFCLDENWQSVALPSDFQALFADLGGALHDTFSHPDIASNFESTPQQLLARAKQLNTEPTGGGYSHVPRETLT